MIEGKKIKYFWVVFALHFALSLKTFNQRVDICVVGEETFGLNQSQLKNNSSKHLKILWTYNWNTG